MASIAAPKPGVLDIEVTQGEDLEVTLEITDGDNNPINLTLFDEIKMDVRESYNVNRTPLFSIDLDSGFIISGEFFNLLKFILGEQFYASQKVEWVYDVRFRLGTKKPRYLMGAIKVNLVSTKL